MTTETLDSMVSYQSADDWLEKKTKGHVFGPTKNGSYPHKNNNKEETLMRQLTLKFPDTSFTFETGTQVVIYRYPSKTSRGDCVAAFFLPDGRVVTYRKGKALQIRAFAARPR
jgi:hypothetical protein